MPAFRVCLVPTDAVNYGQDYNIAVDLVLDEDGLPSRAATAFGARGSLAPEAGKAPFLLFPNGDGDWGSDWEDGRDFTLNIRGAGRRVRAGELFTYADAAEGEIVYRVTKILPL